MHCTVYLMWGQLSSHPSTHQSLPDCLPKAVDKLEANQKGRQKICGKGVQESSQKELSLQAANEALGKWLSIEAGPAVLCR